MFNLPFVVLAHGALGPWDEVIFLGIAVVFMIFMGISWVRSRAMEPDFEDADLIDDDETDDIRSPDRFELK
jgi:hypothetical protein